jgi:hypothetical protein
MPEEQLMRKRRSGGEDKSFVFSRRNLISFHPARSFGGLQTGIRKGWIPE